MGIYVTLIHFVNQEIEDMRRGPARVQEYKELFKKLGAEVKHFYLTTGRYDAVVISEAPTYTIMAKLSLAIGSRGNVKAETFPALTEEEYQEIVIDLP